MRLSVDTDAEMWLYATKENNWNQVMTESNSVLNEFESLVIEEIVHSDMNNQGFE